MQKKSKSKIVRSAVQREKDKVNGAARKKLAYDAALKYDTGKRLAAQNILGKKSGWVPGTRVITVQRGSNNNANKSSTRNVLIMLPSGDRAPPQELPAKNRGG